MRTPVLAALLLLGCSGSPMGTGGGLRLRTNEATYTPGAAITATIVNRLSDAVLVSHCNYRPYLAVEKRTGGVWAPDAQRNGPACLGIYDAGELRIEPGDSVVETLTITAQGEYRLTVYARRPWQDFGDVVAHTSPFTIAFPPD